MMSIWRVENHKGEGCYKNKNTRLILSSHDKDKINHPLPIDDIGIERDRELNEICGFKDLKQAYSWFSLSELIELEKFGYFLRKRIIKQITAEGKKQVLGIR